MANNVWDEFDKAIDTKALADDVKNSADSGNYREVPEGNYEVAIDKLELVASKQGKPMVSVWFKVLTGEYKGSRMFMNQIIEQAFQIHNMNEFLRSLGTDKEIEFVSYKQYGNLLMDVMEEIEGNLEFGVKFYRNKKDYPIYEITDIFEV